MKKIGTIVVIAAGLGLAVFWLVRSGGVFSEPGAAPPENDYADVEARLRPLASPMGPPRPGDWLESHEEKGQTFAEYLQALPIRKTRQRNTLYLCLVGDFTPSQQKIVDVTREYLETFFTVSVKVHQSVSLADIPARAKRRHPQWGGDQVLTTYILDEVLKPGRPDDALAYLAFTASDLWPGEGWNFVFGQASLRERTGVWSIQRFGDPDRSEAARQKCLRRTLGTASHETGHILTMQHCIAFQCNLNGSNNLEEADRQPLHMCPVCLRKLCWNVQAEPGAYLQSLEAFCRKQGIPDEVDWYTTARAALAGTPPR